MMHIIDFLGVHELESMVIKFREEFFPQEVPGEVGYQEKMKVVWQLKEESNVQDCGISNLGNHTIYRWHWDYKVADATGQSWQGRSGHFIAKVYECDKIQELKLQYFVTSKNQGWNNILFEKEDSDNILLDNGTVLLKRYGKYEPNLCFIADFDNPMKYLQGTESFVSQFGFKTDSNPEMLVGDHYISKRGTRCFRIKHNGKHIMYRIDWGRNFGNISRSLQSFDVNLDEAAYYRHARSNGGGTGYDYIVVPREYKKTVSANDYEE